MEEGEREKREEKVAEGRTTKEKEKFRTGAKKKGKNWDKKWRNFESGSSFLRTVSFVEKVVLENKWWVGGEERQLG